MAAGWHAGDAARVAGCLTEDVRYADPTRYRFQRRDDLLPFFAAPPGGQTCVWHRIVFDESIQTGAAEYTYTGHRRYHGAVLITLRNGLISDWREWQHTSDLEWDRFLEGPADV
jgi:hypothetical protein